MPTKRADFAVGVLGGKVICAGGLGKLIFIFFKPILIQIFYFKAILQPCCVVVTRFSRNPFRDSK
jgi:hypothetical protein